jgi:hypothetical protein
MNDAGGMDTPLSSPAIEAQVPSPHYLLIST